VSKLFNTLEKIRHHETSNEPARRSAARKPAAAEKSGTPRLLSLVLLVMLAVVILYTVLLSSRLNLSPLNATFRQVLTTLHLLPSPDANRVATPAPPALPGMLPSGGTAPASAAQQAAQLTKTGIDLFLSGDHWRGIHYFDQARKRNPAAVEPLINMAVALSELGLHGPANRLFREAYAMAPNDPALLRNLATLAESGRLDDALLQKLPHKTGATAAPQVR